MAKSESRITTTIEEALVKTHFGKFNYLLIIFSGIVINNVMLESVGISFVLPILECDMNLTYQQQGVLGAAGFTGIIVSSHIWGFLADTTGRKRIMHPTLILGYMVTIVSSFSPNFITFAVLRFLNGFLLSAGSATIFAYLGEFHSQQYRNRAILFAAFISAFAAIFFPIVAYVFINQDWQFYVPYLNIVAKPWRSFMLACGIPGFLCGISLFFLPESPKYLLTAGRSDEAIEVLEHIYHKNTNLDKNLFNVRSLLPDSNTYAPPTKHINGSKNAVSAIFQLMWRQTVPLFQRQHIRKTLLVSIIQFIISFTAHGVYMWFPYILNSAMQYAQRHSQPLRLCGILKFTQSANFTLSENGPDACVTHLELSTYYHTTMLELIYMGMLLIIIYCVGKFGRKPILFSILLACGACGIFGLVTEIPLVAIYFFLVLLCCGLGTIVLNAIVVDIYPTNLRAMAVCISLMLGRIGGVTGSNVLGTLIGTNCEASLYTSTCSLIVAGFLGFLLPKSNDEKQKVTDAKI